MESAVHPRGSFDEGRFDFNTGNHAGADVSVQSVLSRRAASTLLILAAPIIGATFVSKLAIPGFNIDGVGLGFPLIYLAILWGAYLGDIVALEWSRLMSFCLMAGALGAASALASDKVSVPSIMLLMLLHLPYVFHMQGNDETRAKMLKVFLNIALVVSLCGIAQYVLQTVTHAVPAAWLYPIENFLPPSLRVTGFNMQIPLSYGATVYRPNGIFMQEPSFYSQFLAIAVITEFVTFNRIGRAVLLAFAIVVSQSGTGLILLAICMPVLIIAYRRGDLLVGGIVALLVLMLAAPILHIDLLSRIGEFGSTKSSGYERFIGGFHIFDAALGTEPLRALFGYGAGTYRDVVQSLGHPAAEMALFKIVIEFGVLGALCYFGFIFFCIFSAKGPFVVRLAVASCLFLNGAYNTFVHSLALSLLVWSSASATVPVATWAHTRREKQREDENTHTGLPPGAYGPHGGLAGGSI